MAMNKRPPRKKNTQNEKEVLIRSARRCCLCFGLENDFSLKRGQIAHLDHDRSNDLLDNLVFLCLEHHDEYDSRTSQSKSLQGVEVKTYRDLLYQHVEQIGQARHGATGIPISQRPLTVRSLNNLLADKPHRCSYCGYSFSLLPDLKEGENCLITCAICPKCGNKDEISQIYEG